MTDPRIVLVHGMGATAGTWRAVEPGLRERGRTVVTVENPLRSLSADIAHTEQAIHAAGGPVLLVGHSYGGAVITGAGNHPATVGLVYVAAFAPDEGESVQAIVERRPPAEASAYMRRGPESEWIADCRADFWPAIAWDLDPRQRDMVAEETRWTAARAFTESTRSPAWRHLPSWYLLAEDDRTLRPELQAWMAARAGAAVTRSPGSHFLTYVHPARVVELIERAIETTPAAERA